ncbi:MAG: hypothetical protein CMJ64_08595 [Planctomycetaceae bacterium]|jgi:spore coat polysaccharide biosynthesis protein SpsF (cytidylyltransferase family)|nr:hypothetical protein [Planctomycetaceae bacterium]
MSTTLCIVEVPKRDTSGTYSLAARRFGGTSLVEWVVRRVSESLLVERIIVTCEATQKEALRRLVPPNVTVLGGEYKDSLARYAAAARTADASAIVRVSIDRPFVDPVLIDRLVCDANGHPGTDYVGYVSEDGRSALQAKLGVFADLLRADAIFEAERVAMDPADRADITRFMCSRPDSFQLRLLQAPARLDRRDIRLTIDGEEDWEHANLILDALGPEQLDWQGIADLLANQPDLRHRMAALNETDVTA